MKSYYILTAMVFIFYSCSYNNGVYTFDVDKKISEQGKCFDKCIEPIRAIQEEVSVYEYVGDDFTQIGIESRSFTLNKGGEKWIQKLAKSGCLSPNPKDCMIWCKVKAEEEVFTVLEVVDTSRIKEFKLTKIKLDTRVEQSKPKRIEILCGDRYMQTQIIDIQEQLHKQNYLNHIDGELTTTLQALYNYQKDNQLCFGVITIESLDSLGVSH